MPRDTHTLTLLTSDGVSLAADVWLPAGATLGSPSHDSAVVLVHGFTAHRRDSSVMAMAHDLRDAGHAVIVHDMRGHGDSEGLCTLGDAERHDVAAAVAAARDLAPQVVVVGASLGAIAALRYAVDDPDLTGVVTVSCPAQWKVRSPRAAVAAAITRTRAGRHVARRLGARLDSTWRWSDPPEALAGRLSVPLAVVHGTDDRFMPASEAAVLHAARARTSAGTGADTGDGTGSAGSSPGDATSAAAEVLHRRLDLVPRMGHAFCTRGFDAVNAAVDWCLATSAVAVPAA